MQSEDQLPQADDLASHCAVNAFPRSHRLSGKLRFAAVYDARVKTSKAPLVAYSLPNALGHARLGISMSRRVGVAPKRNRIKRLLREAFRLHQSSLPMGYDLVLVVRPHLPMQLAEYQNTLAHFLKHAHLEWQKRQATKI